MWTFIILALILVVGWGWFSSSLVLKVPRLKLNIGPNTFGLDYTEVEFVTEDQLLIRGWFVPAPTNSSHQSRIGQVGGGSDATIIICHGWGANKSDVVPSTHFLCREGNFNLLYFDFRSHGESEGQVSSIGALELRDLRAALQFLKERYPKESRKIGVYGLSMGGVVALVQAATSEEIKAVVAESAYHSFNESVARFGRLYYHVPKFPFIVVTLAFLRWRLGFDPELYSPKHYIDKISPRPLLIIQGDRDLRMPVSEGRALYQLAKEPKEIWIVPGADHGEPSDLFPEEYKSRVGGFFQKALSPTLKEEL